MIIPIFAVILFPPLQRFVADVVSVVGLCEMYLFYPSVGAFTRRWQVVREADDGEDAAAVGDEFALIVEFRAGVVDEGVFYLFVRAADRTAFLEGVGISAGGHDDPQRDAFGAGPFRIRQLALGAGEDDFAEVAAEGGQYDLRLRVSEAHVIFED
ncbi:hypothetical protein SDC9_212710 [bioreactor metagenome]|uniref:Uncharacterized protein n=1 Tax=bioreactor metagenome TaxID=1076179 RepID=A0A645JMT2_9ZZZZ